MTATSASGNEPFIELSLTDTAFAPNDEVSGAFAVGVGESTAGALSCSKGTAGDHLVVDRKLQWPTAVIADDSIYPARAWASCWCRCR